MGAALVVAARPQARQSVDLRSLPHIGRRNPDPRARYVRALLSHGLRRQSGDLRGHFHGGHSLAERGPTARPSPGRSRRCWWCGTISSNLEEMRMRIAHVLALCTLVSVGTAAGAQEIDWKKVAGRRSSRRRPHAGDGRSRTGKTPRWYVACLLALATVSFAMDRPLAQAPEPLLLQLEGKIPLGDVSGRIDHMAIDLPRRRLFVAELGNDSVAVVDIDERKVQHVITGLKQPQGLGYVPSNDTRFVANAGDGSVRLFRGADYTESGSIDLGEDADNIRVDAASNRVFVGYGSGGLAEIDPATNGKVLDLPLPAHPEGFQLARSVRRIFVNLPKARMIAVIDRFAGKQVASWPVDNESFFPMALDEQSGRILVAFRNPARLGVFSMQDGSNIATVDACGDSDDLFVDAKRHRIYQSCGDGHLDVFEVDGDAYRRSAHIQTISGGRTALFVPRKSTGCSSPPAAIRANRRPFGYFALRRELRCQLTERDHRASTMVAPRLVTNGDHLTIRANPLENNLVRWKFEEASAP